MLRKTLALAVLMALGAHAQAETVDVKIEVQEVEIAIDNAGTTRRMWTYGGTIPGPVIRVALFWMTVARRAARAGRARGRHNEAPRRGAP